MATIDQKFQKLLSRYDEHCRRISKATFININEAAADKIKRIKRLEGNYIRWFEYYFPNYAQCKCAWFHKKFADDIILNIEIYELLEIYRSGAKSVHADMGVPLYLYYTGRLKFMLLIGETEKKAQKLLSACQAQFQYNKRLINDYGNRFKLGDWAAGEFLTTDGVRFMSLGFGQNPRGVREEDQRPDYIVVDDVDNKRHVNNDRLMREGVEWIFEDLMGCFNETDGATKRFVFANNNFHKNSITNRLKTQFKVQINKARENGEKPLYHVLTVPAVKDLNTFEPNWPEKTSADYWRKKYSNTPYRSFMREYMHAHIEDGNVFRLEDMQWKKMLPYNEYDALVFYGDLSYKAAACHKGMILIGKKGREFHIIHVFLRQASRIVLAKWLYDLYESTELRNCRKVRYWIEGLFSMDEFVNDFDTEGDERGYYIPVKADKRPKDNKYDRIEASQSFFERRNVWFNIDERESADQVELKDQYLAFEKGGEAPVDGPDAAEGAFSKLNIAVRKTKTTYRYARRPSRRY
nr:MAG TPA: Large Terminase [Caudoviricetes sp.]